MSRSLIELKGSSFTLSVIYLYHNDPNIVREALNEKISQAPAFLKNAPVVINVSALSKEVNWSLIWQAITGTGLHIVGISGCKDKHLKDILSLSGLPILNEAKEKKINSIEINTIQPSINKTKIISIPVVRSGQQIYAKNSDLIIISNVSAGAELIADGNIHIYGMMRGRAIAGVSGDISCQIFCTALSAELISIAGNYWTMEQIPVAFLEKAARIYIKDGMLDIQKLN